ncbi:sensor histidine kinase [Sulfitobacter mediterraneus]|jgi:signal transduction histidine kinase|uniref:histidine kinase n=1 Tax=Sulfitobacter mediterraneus TaxID=83219 RepID=A0A2T6CC67_9RHOB|nr:HAMP domain-containing sensor histidine kinase [Sulfitobacter mediterraneus]KIN79171.1 Two-component hybrid sensor and regulator [Sulfitobacter mediterraneus KCTC 32188]PTX73091.1 signal transduction histidine kinase [Sulfitobacter mediterraneus]UWR10436.1 HAMP domain-containing histidine kinase [Sulfitobacter mediterraneus]
MYETGQITDPQQQDGVAEMLTYQLKDYAKAGLSLFWQRQAIFGSALLLEAYYYSPLMAAFTLCLVIASEIFDFMCFRRIMLLNDYSSDREAFTCLMLVQVGTVVSAGIIAFFALSISLAQGPTTHFMPLFFLFAAALFAAMNNHQILSLIVMRLLIYGVTFLFIPIWDIWQTSAPLNSELWAQFFTSIFVVYFIIDCSRIYMKFYERNRQQLQKLQIEHETTKNALRSKSEFLATISHELRTPLTSVKGSLDLACAGALGPMPDKLQNALGIAQRNASRLHALIAELLDLQQIESGKMSFTFETVKADTVIRRCVSSLEPYADGLNVRYVLGDMPDDVYVHADEARLEQVVTNIMSNAAKFSFEGGEVDISMVATDDKLRILVRDRGIGLEIGDKEKVFDRFSQLDSSDQRRAGGTGLGMNISKKIVEAHGGSIDYVPNPDKGTTFFIEFDRAAMPAEIYTAEAS